MILRDVLPAGVGKLRSGSIRRAFAADDAAAPALIPLAPPVFAVLMVPAARKWDATAAAMSCDADVDPNSDPDAVSAVVDLLLGSGRAESHLCTTGTRGGRASATTTHTSSKS